jgi:dienelactone hydrolase
MHPFPVSHCRRVLVFLLTWLTLSGCYGLSRVQAAAATPTAPTIIQLPTQRPSGDALNDVIWVTFYPAKTSVRPAPAIVLLHPIGEGQGDLSDRFMHHLAQQFADRGIGCALMTLPWHSQRLRPHIDNLFHYIGPNIDDVLQAFSQSSSDVSTVTTWLTQRSDVDPHRLGVVGISLGAIIAHLAMGQDPRLTAGVAMEGGGNLPELYHTSAEVILHGKPASKPLTAADFARLSAVDPANNAQGNRPRHVLMIEAARDLYIPPTDATFLWKALGRPPIQWLDTNHFAFLLTGDTLVNAAATYMNAIWDGKPEGSFAIPRVRAVTIKFGWLYEFSGFTTPDIQWQFLGFGARSDHLSLFDLNLGESGRGPFASFAVTATPYFDVGVAQTVRGRPIQPYISWHLVF